MSGCEQIDARDIVRKELRGFVASGERAGLDQDNLRRFARVSPEDWQRWLGILKDEPLPEGIRLPLVLRHIGYVNARLQRATQAA